MKVFGYIRVSGKGQLDGDGYDRQRAGIEAYCALKGYEVLRWFYDGAVSGTIDGIDRAEFAEMLLMAGPETVTLIVVERADRLARELMVSELCVEEARKRGLKIVEAASDMELTDSSDPSRVAMRQMFAVFAQWNKSVMVARLAGSRIRIKRSGKRCEGRKPFHERSEHDAETLGLIMGWRSELRWSFSRIARELHKRKRNCPQEAVCWHKSSAHLIYKDEVMRQNPEPVRAHLPSLTEGLI